MNNVYSYNAATSTLSQVGLAASIYNPSTCTCQNALKEVQYTVYYSMNSNGLYTISSILADVVLYSQISATSTYCSGAATTPLSV